MGKPKRKKDPLETEGTYTQGGFATALGISRQAVHQARKAGRVRLDENGRVDPRNEVNQEFIRFHTGAVKASGINGSGRPIGGDNQQYGRSIAEIDRYYAAQIKAVKLEEVKLEFQKKCKEMLSFDIVARSYSRLASLLDVELIRYDQNVIDRLCEIFDIDSADKRTKASQYLKAKIDEAIARINQTIIKELEDMKVVE